MGDPSDPAPRRSVPAGEVRGQRVSHGRAGRAAEGTRLHLVRADGARVEVETVSCNALDTVAILAFGAAIT